MAHSWKYAFALGLVGSALAVGCVVKEGDGDDEVGGASGEGGTGGSTGGKGGTGGGSGKGGASGKGGTGGGAGSGTTGGAGGTTGGSSGDAGMGGSDTGGTSGTGGTGGTNDVIECEDTFDSTPFPNCEATSTEKCDVCIEMNCCEESRECYATGPKNACGWGGPGTDEFEGLYSGAGEIGCYLTCLAEYVADNDGICDNAGIDQCTAMCTTDCSLVPDATNEMVACVNLNCSQDCFESEAETCGD